MGIIRTEIALSNPRNGDLSGITVPALVDTCTLNLCIPQAIAFQLQLQAIDQRPVTFANGETKLCSYVGPIQVKWQKRTCFVGAMVLGDEVLLGSIPMEDMDLIIHSATLKVDVNPQHPNMPASMAK